GRSAGIFPASNRSVHAKQAARRISWGSARSGAKPWSAGSHTPRFWECAAVGTATARVTAMTMGAMWKPSFDVIVLRSEAAPDSGVVQRTGGAGGRRKLQDPGRRRTVLGWKFLI